MKSVLISKIWRFTVTLKWLEIPTYNHTCIVSLLVVKFKTVKISYLDRTSSNPQNVWQSFLQICKFISVDPAFVNYDFNLLVILFDFVTKVYPHLFKPYIDQTKMQNVQCRWPANAFSSLLSGIFFFFLPSLPSASKWILIGDVAILRMVKGK